MAYEKNPTWVNRKNNPINADALNHIEDGIFFAAQEADNAMSQATYAINIANTARDQVSGISDQLQDLADRIAALEAGSGGGGETGPTTVFTPEVDSSLPDATIGTSYSTTITVNDSDNPDDTYEFTDPYNGLPAGLTIATTGPKEATISGNPTGTSTGDVNFGLTVSGSPSGSVYLNAHFTIYVGSAT